MRQIATLGNIAQFSKFLNSIPPLKALRPATKFGQAREVLYRINNAADDLVMRTGNKYEGLYHLNKKGKASKFTTEGDPTEVAHLYWDTPKAKNYTVHNHPQNSSLSSGDLLANYNPQSQMIAVDKFGSKYRSYPKTDETKKAMDHILMATEELEGKAAKRLNEFNLPSQQERALAFTHYKNRAMKKLGLIHYSAKIKNPAFTPEVKSEGKKIEQFFYNKYKKAYDEYLSNQ